jgi:transposase-like protein
VTLVTEQGYWAADAARSLDVVAKRLARWNRKYEVQGKGELLYRDELV